MNSLIDNRTIRVFISSTFQDMQDERTELIRRTFPRLRELASQRDVTLTEVDLRWGITKEESEFGKVMEICLREVENSIPFFIGIIGNRYGWIPEPKDISEIVKERFPKVPGYVERQLSATEIEMQFGVLDRTDVDMNAYFFIKKEETADVDDPERLAALKKLVRENKKYPVSSYSDPEDLAEQVQEAFTELLDNLFPVGELSALEKERLGQRAVLNNLSRVYIKNEANFAVIDKWMEDWEKHQLVITGESGLGKSALVANWIKEKMKLGDALPYRIIYHFVGYGGSIGSDWHVVKALCDEIRNQYGFDTEEKEPQTDEKALDELIKQVAAEGDKPLLIVLDGINQIVDVNHAKRLNWLPIPPRKVKVLFTTLPDDETMQVFKDRNYPVFTLSPLTRDERIEMVRKYLDETYRKHLQDNQLERIVDDPQNENTLVLKTLLDEVANFGIFDKLDEKIEEYLQPDSIGDFYQVVLKNYETDFGEELVRHFLSLIAVSRNGLSEDELLDITDTKDKPLLWSQFYCSFRQHMIEKNGLVSFSHGYIREAMEERYIKDQDDWVKTCREEIVAALENQKNPDGKKTTRSMDEVPYQLDLLGDTRRLHEYLLDWDVFVYLYKNEETTIGKYWRKLMDTGEYSINEYRILVESLPRSVRAKQIVVLSKFSSFLDPSLSLTFAESAAPFTVTDRKGRTLDFINYEERADVLDQRGIAYRLSGDYKKALECFQNSLRIRRCALKDDNHSEIRKSFIQLAILYLNIEDYPKALEYGEKSLQIQRESDGESDSSMAACYDIIGSAYAGNGEYQKALSFQERALRIRVALFGESDIVVASSYNNVGQTYGELGDLQKELEYEEKALKIGLALFGEKNPEVATFYNNVGQTYGELGDLQKELEYKEKALKIRLSLFGENYSEVETAYNNIGLISLHLGEYQKALDYWKKALAICQYNEDKDFSTAQLYSNVGTAYACLGENKKALECFLKAIDIFTQVSGEYCYDNERLYNNSGAMYGRLGDTEKELEFRLKGLDVAQRISHNDFVADYLNRIAKAYQANNQPDKARDYFRQAAEKYRELGDEKQAQANLNEMNKC